MISITAIERAFVLRHQHTVVTADEALVAAAKAAYATQDVCYFRKVVDPLLLAQIISAARNAELEPELVPGLGERRQEKRDEVGAAVRAVMGRTSLLDWMTMVAGCDPLTRITGRLVETQAGSGQGLIWHNDLSDRHRRLAVVVNFSDAAYEGGEFEMRRKDDRSGHFSFVHPEPGSAMIFRVTDYLEHRVLPVTGGGPRRVFAGWMEADTEQPRTDS